jgi:hypothetical protein
MRRGGARFCPFRAYDCRHGRGRHQRATDRGSQSFAVSRQARGAGSLARLTVQYYNLESTKCRSRQQARPHRFMLCFLISEHNRIPTTHKSCRVQRGYFFAGKRCRASGGRGEQQRVGTRL